MRKTLSLIVVLSMLAVYLPSLGGLTVLAEEATEAVEETTEKVTEEVTEEEENLEWLYTSFTYDNNTEDTADDTVGVMVTEYLGTQTDIYVPAEIDNLPVLKLGEGIFKDNTAINSVTLSSNIKVIGKEAFSGCTNLVCIVTNEGLMEIEENAFLNCVNYNSVILYDAVAVIADTAFSGCEILTIYCVENSVAYNYAVEKNIKWVLLGSETEPEVYVENGITYYIQNGEAIAISAESGMVDVVIPSSVKGYPVTELRGTFENCCNTLTSVVLPNSITTIGDKTFNCCYYLTSIKLPDGVITIGNYAFYNCSKLSTIIMPDRVTTIGDSAFRSCTKLTSVVVPESVETIGAYAFFMCKNLVNIKLPNKMASIGNYAFYGCSSLVSVNIPDGVTTVGQSVFSNCSSMTSVDIPSSVTEIGNSAFEACESLTEIEIPNSVTLIGSYAFSNCTNLVNVNMGNGVIMIYSNAFIKCASLIKMKIPSSVKSIWSNSFSDNMIWVVEENSKAHTYAKENDRLYFVENEDKTIEIVENNGITYYIMDGEAIAIKSQSNLTTVEIPATINGYQVTKLRGTFENCTDLISVVIPNTIIAIETKTFYKCVELINIKIPDSVATIGENAFAYCSKLAGIEIPDSVTTIGGYAFYSCSGIADIGLSQSLESIGGYAFSGCSGLTEVNIPGNVLTIGESAFRNCTNLIKATISYGVEEIGSNAFCGCSSLNNVIIPNSVTSLGSDAFINCTELISVEIPSSITRINTRTFSGCNKLTSISIPDGVTAIGNNAFYGCEGIIKVKIPSSVTTVYTDSFSNNTVWIVNEDSYAHNFAEENNITYVVTTDNTEPEFVSSEGITYCIINDKAVAVFAEKTLTDIELPESVNGYPLTELNGTFKNCEILTNVEIPDSVNVIGDYTFYCCRKLESIIIPNSVTAIGKYAFRNCDSIVSVEIPDSITTIGGYAFWYCNSLKNVKLPVGITEIERFTFSDCRSLENIEIPDSVTTIGDNAFYLCSNLPKIELPEELKEIGGYAFYGCKTISEIEIPDGVTTIKGHVFASCGNLSNVIIPDGVEAIQESAFVNCSSLSYITLPNSITSIAEKSFPDTTIWIVNENSYVHTFAEENNRLYFVLKNVVNPEIAYGSAIAGTVTDNSGNAIVGATVDILYDDGTVKESVTTDETGAYEFTYAEVGRYTIRATDANGNTTHEVVSIKRMNVFDVYLAGETDLVITSSYDVTGAVIGGSEGTATITDETGVVIAITTVTGGSFTFDAIPNGDYIIKAETESGVAVGEVTVFGEETTVELTVEENTATVTGLVQDEYGNTRIWATVTFYDSEGVAVASVKTDKDGRYTVTGLDVDEYAIVAESGDIRDDKHHGHKRSYVLKGYGYIDVTEAGEFEADVIIVYDENDHECSIEGKVTAQGSPQVSEVVLHDVFRNEVAKYETKNNGKYKFVNIKDGLYFITARTEDNGMGMTVVSVRHGKVCGRTDIYVCRPDKIKEHEDKRHEIGDCSSRDEALEHKDKIVEEKRFYDSLSKKEKKHCSKEYVDWLHRMIEWINEVEYEVSGDELDAKFEHGGSMVDCDEIEREESVKIEVTIEKRDRVEIGEEGVKTEDEFIQQSIEDAAGDGELGQYYNISMRKGDGENYKEVDNIHRDTHTTGKMRITMPIPEEYRGHENYCFVHVHNGEAVKLIDLDDDPDTITFETDKFSTFALMWHDKPFIEDVSKDVVKIGDVFYTSLQEAINAAIDNSVIVLCDNVKLGSEVIVSEKAVTIDLAGYTLTGNIVAGAGAYVTVTDSSEAHTGKVDGSITVDIEDVEKLTSMLTVYDGICDNIVCGNLSTIGVGDGYKVYRGDAVGVNMVDGAQVRIGDGVDENRKVSSGSGLRFVTQIDRNDSLVNAAYAHYDAQTGTYDEGYEIGVKITAEGSDATVYIPATKWQSEGDVFTSALTNLAESNYNRRFTATAYVKLEGVCYETAVSTTRSVYEVAAGLLTDTYAEEKIYAEDLVKVLNAYANQTGIRLVLGETEGFYDIHDEKSVLDKGGKYSGNAFFEIENAKVEGNIYSVDIRPIGINTYIETGYFAEYIRINNNNGKVKDYVTMTDNNNGTYTLKFDYGMMTAN